MGHPPPVAPQLEDYLVAHLLQSLGSRKLRVSFWGGGVTAPAFVTTICGLTGGAVLGGGLAGPPLIAAPPIPSYYEVSWPSPGIKRGFQLYRAALLRRAGTTLVEVPWLAAAPEAELPGPERYLTSREPIEEANALFDHQLQEMVASLTDAEVARVVEKCGFKYMQEHQENFEMHPPHILQTNAELFVAGTADRFPDLALEQVSMAFARCCRKVGQHIDPPVLHQDSIDPGLDGLAVGDVHPVKTGRGA